MQGTDLGDLLAGNQLLETFSSNRLIRRNWQRTNGLPNNTWEPAVWRGLSVPHIGGIRNVTISPFCTIAGLTETLASLQPLANSATQLFRRFAQGAALNIADLQAAFDALNSLSDLLRTIVSGPFLILNASSISLSASPAGVGISTAAPNQFPTVVCSANAGSTGSITMQAFNTGYSYSQFLNSGYDEGTSRTDFVDSRTKRIVTRAELSDEDTARVRGAEVMWQRQLADILTFSIPLNVTLPATAGRAYRTSDDSIRVRFGNSVRPSVSVDIWFDTIEEAVPHDY
jgi:hypothetical protein